MNESNDEKEMTIDSPVEQNRDKLKEKIVIMHTMITKGCGQSDCSNPHCASNNNVDAKFDKVTALKQAITLARSSASPCVALQSINNQKWRAVGVDCSHTIVDTLINCPVNESIKAVDELFSNASSLEMTFSNITCSDEASISITLLNKFYTQMQIIGFSHFNKILHTSAECFLTSAQAAVSLSHVRALIILLQCDLFLDPESHDTLLTLFSLATLLTNKLQSIAIDWFVAQEPVVIERLVGIVQSYITVRWYTRRKITVLRPAAIFLRLLYRANEQNNAVPYTEFYNEVINSELDLKTDFVNWQETSEFCFSRFPFLLDAASKSALIQMDAHLQMSDQFDDAIMRCLFTSSNTNNSTPFLILDIRRDRIVADSLTQLQGRNSADFKKPLKIKFVGEAGVDEGGIQKEFFQLLVRQLFDTKFGMFVVDEDSHLFWFNKNSLDTLEFELIGIILGLAIYNGVILDVHFPMVVYKKLLGIAFNFQDLKDYNPMMHRGFQQLLDFDGNVEEVYHRTFSVEYSVFGEHKVDELKSGGSKIPLTNENRKEYVDLYAQYTFGTSVSKQFASFKFGFDLVCAGDPLQLLRPEELEMAICGSQNLDFSALQESARYENYTIESAVIINFWQIVHQFDEDQKRHFLAFCTGSDRVPINGLGALKVPFVVAKNGDDSDRLPTSHTCFNHLLLPEYNTIEKLRERLLTAISNSEGFGLT